MAEFFFIRSPKSVGGHTPANALSTARRGYVRLYASLSSCFLVQTIDINPKRNTIYLLENPTCNNTESAGSLRMTNQNAMPNWLGVEAMLCCTPTTRNIRDN